MAGRGTERAVCTLRCRGQGLRGERLRQGGTGEACRRTALFEGGGRGAPMGQHQHTGRVQRILRQLDGSAAGILPHHSGGRAEAICPVGHRDRAGHGSTAGWHVDKAGRGSGSLRCAGKRAARAGKPGGRSCLRHAGAERRERPVDQLGRQGDTQLCGEHAGADGTPRAGSGLRYRVRQPGMGLQQQGKRDLCLPLRRPHQLVLLPGHCGRQLRSDGGQRWCVYRRGHMHGLCTVL